MDHYGITPCTKQRMSHFHQRFTVHNGPQLTLERREDAAIRLLAEGRLNDRSDCHSDRSERI